MTSSLGELSLEAWEIAERSGWHGPKDHDGTGVLRHASVLERIALCHSELSEAVEAYRRTGLDTFATEETGKVEGWGSELADTIIRICELAQITGVDLDALVQAKNEYNSRRLDVPAREGGKSI